jgi:hypothetical protein
MKTFFYTLLTICILNSCNNQSQSLILPEKEQSKTILIDTNSIKSTLLKDTCLNDSTILIQKVKANHIEKPVKKVVTEPKVIPEEKLYYESVRDDPNYVGTPCRMINGECINHKHL